MSGKPKKQCRQVIVLDTSAFVAGFDPFSLSIEQVTVPMVEDEIKRNNMVSTRFRTAIENGRLKVKAPSGEFLNKAKNASSKAGDSYSLSSTDIQLLALALELKAAGCTPHLVTDDYSIQNVATRMGIEFVALATFGIKRLLEWIRYCPACHREYPADCTYKECVVCGTELKRKPRRTVRTLKAR